MLNRDVGEAQCQRNSRGRDGTGARGSLPAPAVAPSASPFVQNSGRRLRGRRDSRSALQPPRFDAGAL
jgi:hypothetical protein